MEIIACVYGAWPQVHIFYFKYGILDGKAVNPGGFKYWQYVLIFTDYILTISHEPHSIMEGVTKLYCLKGVLQLRRPIMSLGVTLEKTLVGLIYLMKVELHILCWVKIVLRRL